MIAGALFLAAAAAEPAVDQTSLFFECKMSAPAGDQHELGFVYFEPRVADAFPLNFKDPDHLLPSMTEVAPAPINMWPTALLVAFPRSKTDSGRPGSAILVEPNPAEAGTASAKIGSLRDGKWVADAYAGTCIYTEGTAAEQKFRNLANQ